MLISRGPRPEPEGLVGLLLECHARIRSFIRLAVEIADRDDVPAAEIVDASQRCERYFSEALPLHVEDEELSLRPRLLGATPEVDDALQEMHDQHAAHGVPLERLLTALRALQAEPASPDVRDELREVATSLTRDFDAHLSLEESVILPAIPEVLSSEQQLAVMAELRARRQVAPS